MCDVTIDLCDPNCCCDTDCSPVRRLPLALLRAGTAPPRCARTRLLSLFSPRPVPPSPCGLRL